MGVSKELFGKTTKGEEIYRYWLENSKGMKAGIINYGAILVNLFVPDKNGKADDIVLGYDTLEPYYDNGSFFGSIIGPNANRICDAKFSIDGVEYQLDVNDGPNNLHSHYDLGYHKRVWAVEEGADFVKFSIEDEDGCMGFPGNKKVAVTYTLTEDNELKLFYDVASDKDTIVNMTNHTYFNLAGHNSGQIIDHKLTLNCSKYTPVVAGAIPTGELADVKGTVFDFTAPRRIGDNIDDDLEQLTLVQGYDHNWVIDCADGTMRETATLECAETGRTMKVYTDLPGIQFYAGNCIADTVGKDKTPYGKRSGMCLETQFYPDTANQKDFPSAVFGPNRPYKTETIFKFI